MQSTLQGTSAFATVDIFNAGDLIGTPAPEESMLATYHAVLVFSDIFFDDPVLLGDRLAAFHDQGGGVVIAYAANLISSNVKGIYGAPDNGYALLNYDMGRDVYATVSGDTLGSVLELNSPLMAGVTSLSALYRSSAPPIADRAVVVARWRGGGQEPLVLRGKRGEQEPSGAEFQSCVGDGIFWWVDRGWRELAAQRAQVLAVHH